MDADKLLKMKRAVDAAKTKQAETEGAIKQAIKTMKETFGVTDVAAGKKKVKQLEIDIARKEEALKDGVADLEVRYDW